MQFKSTIQDVREDLAKLKNLFETFKEMSDDEIEPINEEFYGFLEQAEDLAEEFGLSAAETRSYYKLRLWLEMVNGA